MSSKHAMPRNIDESGPFTIKDVQSEIARFALLHYQ